MTIFQAVVLGLLQGLSEFLPISSSAHLALAPWAFGWRDPGLAFDVALHVGTLAAVLWFFRQEWVLLTRAALRIVRQRGARTPEERRVLFIVGATIPAGIAGLLLSDLAETAFRSPRLIGTNLMVMGVVLWAVDRWAPRGKALDEMTWRDAMLIGFAQMLALVPGVSRSGSTITGGRAVGLSRESAAVFSFLMSVPITLAATIKEVPAAIAQATSLAPLLAGVIASGLSGWAAIAVLLRFVANRSLAVFAVYRLLLGAGVLLLLAARGG